MSITVVPWYLQDEDHFLCRLIFLFFFFICGKSFYCSNFLVLVLEFLTVFLFLCCRRRICPSSSSSPSNLAAFKKNSLLNGIHFCSSRGDGGHRPLPSSPGEESVLFQVCWAASRSCVLKFHLDSFRRLVCRLVGCLHFCRYNFILLFILLESLSR